eukprot:7330772-Alexandrium_andersonii.AAC.1
MRRACLRHPFSQAGRAENARNGHCQKARCPPWLAPEARPFRPRNGAKLPSAAAGRRRGIIQATSCLLYTSDAADDM